MMQPDDSPIEHFPQDSGRPGANSLLAYLVAVAVMGAAVGCAAWWLVIHSRQNTLTPQAILAGVVIALGGMVLAGVLGALGALMRLLESQNRQLAVSRHLLARMLAKAEQAPQQTPWPAAALAAPDTYADQRDQAVQEGVSGPAEPSETRPVEAPPVSLPVPAAPVAAAAVAQPIAPLVDMLQELREILLMDDAQRTRRARHYFQQRQADLLFQLRTATHDGRWNVAQPLAEQLQTAFAEDPAVQDAIAEFNAGYTAAVTRDLAAAQEDLRKAISVRAWQTADDRVQALLQLYPADTQVRELVASVARERKAAAQEEFTQLVEDLRGHTDRRQWRKAHEVALQLLARFPQERKVEKLRQELPVLEENALVEARLEAEAQFKDLLQRQRYQEAARVAHEVIERYPESSSAQELQRLLPKIQERIQQEKMKRQTAPV